jgi:hypothetical protein
MIWSGFHCRINGALESLPAVGLNSIRLSSSPFEGCVMVKVPEPEEAELLARQTGALFLNFGGFDHTAAHDITSEAPA